MISLKQEASVNKFVIHYSI